MSRPKRPMLPIFLDLEERAVLLVGGGLAALEKLEKLWPTGARLFLVAERLHPRVRAGLEAEGTPWEERPFHESDLAGRFLVISAVNNPTTHARIAAAARAQGVLVNTVDAPESTDFYFGSQITRGPLQLAISTQGLFPGVARALRLWLEENFPPELERELNELSLLRRLAQARIPDPQRRMQALREQLALWLEQLADAESPDRRNTEPSSPGVAL